MEQSLLVFPTDENPAAAIAGRVEQRESDVTPRNQTLYSAGMRDLRPNRSMIVSQVMLRPEAPARLSEEDDSEAYDDWNKLGDKQKLVALHREVISLGRRHCNTLQMLSDKVEQLNAELERLRLGQPGKADPDGQEPSLHFQQGASTHSISS